MAAYAALVSLMNTMDQIQIHPGLSTCFNKNHIESLGDTVVFLLDFIESYNGGGRSKEVEDLEGQIASAAHAAEDVIESHIVDQVLSGSTKIKISLLQKKLMRVLRPRVMCDLQKVTKDMDSIKEYIIVRFEDRKLIISSTVPPRAAASSRPGKTSMVGFDDYLIHLMDRLTGHQSYKQVIPIIGMGGVGKTTLAINAFQSLLIKQHFDVREWATISQNYSAREILLQLLSSQEDDSTEFMALDKHQLGEKLHKYLFNRRYLIVLDDMWSIEVWDEIMSFFPDNINGSRIIVTSRLHNICLHFNSHYLTINLLDKDKSWNLFCQESFGEESCPAELEEVGKKICENCKGLPLSIVVIGGFLRKSNKEQEYWEDVARDTYSVLNSEGNNQCMNILYLSYNHLHVHLKPCFLYMGVFVEDEKIRASRLVKLWMAEGFLRPNDAQSLEEVAEGYLKDLVGRNLVLVNRWGSNGKIKACNTHDLIRELCLRVAEKENFLFVMKLVDTPRVLNRERRIVIHESMPLDLGSATSLVRSLICRGHRRFNLRLLRVLNVVDKEPYDGFLDADLGCVNLRCTGHQFDQASSYPPYLYIPKKISMLWNLQTVRIEGYLGQVIAPSELWEMVQLRHLQVPHLYVPNPPQNDRGQLVLQNLQTLCRAMNFQLSEEVCKRIPNVKKLSLIYKKSQIKCYAGLYYCPQNLGRFHKLESLSLNFTAVKCHHMFLNVTFPTSLKKLTLLGGHDLYWEDLGMIGTLPNLEVLKLLMIIGSEWNPGEGEFPRLKFLQIHGCQNLTKWNADYFHFPVLEKLVLGVLHKLDEIPSGIGEIPTLQNIRLFLCSVPIALSAVKILQKQESSGNEDLQVEVVFYITNKKGLDIFRKMVEREGFTSNNLHVNVML